MKFIYIEILISFACFTGSNNVSATSAFFLLLQPVPGVVNSAIFKEISRETEAEKRNSYQIMITCFYCHRKNITFQWCQSPIYWIYLSNQMKKKKKTELSDRCSGRDYETLAQTKAHCQDNTVCLGRVGKGEIAT